MKWISTGDRDLKCITIPGISVVFRGGWFVLDRRGAKARMRGPYSGLGVAMEAAER